MSRISDILLLVRDSLADSSAQRWSDARLLRLLSEAQKDIARHTRVLRSSYTFSVLEGVSNYTLPDNIHVITRAASGDCEIPLITYDQLDEQYRKIGTCWETETGNTIEALVYDRRNMDDIRVFPIPDSGIADNTYTFENTGDLTFVGDDALGITIGIDDYTLTSLYGVAVDLYDPLISLESFDTPYGVVSSITESNVQVTIWYTALAPAITSLDDTLTVPSMYDAAMRYYIIGTAFTDDNDAAFRQKGADAMAMYDRELNVAKNMVHNNGVRNAAARTTSYRSAFE